ncbi:carbonic anhydrase [Leeia aquatica]|uniref:carbonic anhydrase n=1 Tax=Leeia aquatica TaxID=2725557 RepID=A0A847S8I0_9NEIS|nr:surface-adhesin E family protein [Leeia aquatica]NLR75165.1 hypothetical protein [Leeia aquatica]
MTRFVALLALLCCLPASAAWRTVYSNNSVAVSMDESTWQVKGMQATLWTRDRYVQAAQADPGDFYFKSMNQQAQYACDRHTITPLLTVYYDLADQEIKRLNGDGKAIPVVPGSLEERKFNLACKVTPVGLVKENTPPPPGKPAAAPAGKPATGKPADKGKPGDKANGKKPEAKPGSKPEAKPETALTAASGPVAIEPPQGESTLSEAAQIRNLLQNLREDNDRYRKARNEAYFKPIRDGQFPRATVVTCADSRVQTPVFDQNPEGDLFMVRNIGNQLVNSEGSVEYGVRHLKTPVLIFVGHVACGAVKAAMGDYSEESRPIRKELDNLRLDKKLNLTDNVIRNVHLQVRAGMIKFEPEVKAGKLAVIGAVYDFRNDLKQGYGKLVFVDYNGETSAAKIAKLIGSSDSKPAAPAKPVKKKP